MATISGSPGASARNSQLAMKSVTMTTLVAPCHIPTALARAGGDRQPIDQAEHRRSQTTDNAGRDHPERDLRPLPASCKQVNDVEDGRRREQPQWERDQYWVYWVSHYLGFALHALLLPIPRLLTAAPFSIVCTIPY